jgi:hypothetical protein
MTNRSGICTACWSSREAIYQAQKAIEAVAGIIQPKELSAGRRASLTTARRAKLLKEMAPKWRVKRQA